MAERPFFTILTPVYKGMDFVPGCAESVRAQGFDDVGVMILAVLNAIRALFVKNL